MERRRGRSSAGETIAGYTIVHDVSERAWQLERGSQGMMGRSYDTSRPLAPWLVTRMSSTPHAEPALTCR